MPIYEYYCKKCQREWETVVPIAARDAQTCCEHIARRKVSVPAKNHWLNYFSPELGQHITSPAQREKVERELGVVATSHIKHTDDITKKPEYNSGPQKDFDKVFHEVTNAS